MSRTKLFNYICAGLLLLLIILQFMPFWHVGEENTGVSLQAYVWMPSDHADLTKQLTADVEGFGGVDDIVLMPALVLLLGAVGIVTCCIKGDNWAMSILPLICGLLGLIGYAGSPALHLGSGWAFQMIICIAILAMSCLNIVTSLVKPEN